MPRLQVPDLPRGVDAIRLQLKVQHANHKLASLQQCLRLIQVGQVADLSDLHAALRIQLWLVIRAATTARTVAHLLHRRTAEAGLF